MFLGTWSKGGGAVPVALTAVRLKELALADECGCLEGPSSSLELQKSSFI